MAKSSFDLIAQEVVKQQHLMKQMQIENQELRRQIADLKAGRGLFIEIGGQRFAPLEEQHTLPSTRIAPPAAQKMKSPSTATTPNAEASESSKPQQAGTSHVEKDKKPTPPTFLEEIMIDEFAQASTMPRLASTKKQETTEEEQMAALRRELMGSFLLE